jgi:hypothetical protein
LFSNNAQIKLQKHIHFNTMKKVAFTLALAFCAFGLFAQNTTGTNQAKATSAPVSVVKKEPMKGAPAAKPAAAASTAKPANAMPAHAAAEKPATAKAKPSTAPTSSTAPVKKHRSHKAKSTDATKAKAAPKTNKQ